jgi:hypothetical protein
VNSWVPWSCPFHRRFACPGPVPVRGCWATSRRAACNAPVRSGEARSARASATDWADLPTPPVPARSPAIPARRTPPNSTSASHRRTRATSAARPSPAHRPTRASAGRGGLAAVIEGSRHSMATSAPATGPTAAHAVARSPCSPASTPRPTIRASTPARLMVAAIPASSPAAATASGTEPGEAIRRPRTTRPIGARTAAVAFGYVNVEEARHRPWAWNAHAPTRPATPSQPITATSRPIPITPASRICRSSLGRRRQTTSTATTPTTSDAGPTPTPPTRAPSRTAQAARANAGTTGSRRRSSLVGGHAANPSRVAATMSRPMSRCTEG